MRKPTELIHQIKALESTPRNLEALFTLQEIAQLKALKDLAYQVEANRHEKLFHEGKPRGISAHPTPDLKRQIEAIVKPKVSALVDCEFDMEFCFHNNAFPYGIHTDSGYDDEELIFKQGIIPLEVADCRTDVYTVIFDQKCYHSFGFPRCLGSDLTAARAQAQTHIEGFSNEDFIPNEEISRYWGRAGDKEWLNGFSIALAFPWVIGNMALWDRAHLHCSSDFDIHGVPYKLGLMWISRRSSSSPSNQKRL